MAGMTWLHLSDWHQRGDELDREVMRDELIVDIEMMISSNADLAEIDFLVFSGDVAYSGKEEEYKAAKEFLCAPLLKTMGLKANKLFVVPGNHDFDDVTFKKYSPPAIRQPFNNKEEVEAWLKKEDDRKRVLEPFEAYSNFVSEYTGQEQPAYANTRIFEIDGKQVALLGLNSALMCRREVNDYGHLVVGEIQVYEPLKLISGADIRLAILHHPFGWLKEFDRTRIKDQLGQKCQFILCGHEHMSVVESVRGVSGEYLIISAGAGYDRRTPSDPRYINAYNLVHFDFVTKQRKKCLKGSVYLRHWSDRHSHWVADTDTYPDGKFPFELRYTPRRRPTLPSSPTDRNQDHLTPASTTGQIDGKIPHQENTDTSSNTTKLQPLPLENESSTDKQLLSSPNLKEELSVDVLPDMSQTVEGGELNVTSMAQYIENRETNILSRYEWFLKQARKHLDDAQKYVQDACSHFTEEMYPTSMQFEEAIELLEEAEASLQTLYKLLHETTSLPVAIVQKKVSIKDQIDTSSEQIKDYLIPCLTWNNRGDFSLLQEALRTLDRLIFGEAPSKSGTDADFCKS